MEAVRAADGHESVFAVKVAVTGGGLSVRDSMVLLVEESRGRCLVWLY